MQIRDLERTLVYIAGPYSAPSIDGIEKNIRQAEKYALALAQANIYFICPHLNTAYFDSKIKINEIYYYNLGFELLARSDVLLVLPGWQKSKGTLKEIAQAKKNNKLIYYINSPQPKDISAFVNWLVEETLISY